jgi:hypothetical protein
VPLEGVAAAHDPRVDAGHHERGEPSEIGVALHGLQLALAPEVGLRRAVGAERVRVSRDAALRRVATRRGLVVPSLLADVRIEELDEDHSLEHAVAAAKAEAAATPDTKVASFAGGAADPDRPGSPVADDPAAADTPSGPEHPPGHPPDDPPGPPSGHKAEVKR